MAYGIIYTSMHSELVKGSEVHGKLLNKYTFGIFTGLYWMRVKLSNGVNRDILVKPIEKPKPKVTLPPPPPPPKPKEPTKGDLEEMDFIKNLFEKLY